MPDPADDVSNLHLPQLALLHPKSGPSALPLQFPPGQQAPGVRLASTVQWPGPIAAQPPKAREPESAWYRFAAQEAASAQEAGKYRPQTNRPTSH